MNQALPARKHLTSPKSGLFQPGLAEQSRITPLFSGVMENTHHCCLSCSLLRHQQAKTRFKSNYSEILLSKRFPIAITEEGSTYSLMTNLLPSRCFRLSVLETLGRSHLLQLRFTQLPNCGHFPRDPALVSFLFFLFLFLFFP